MHLLEVKPLGVLIAAVVTFLIGMLWYSPLLFANAWVRLNGHTPEKLAEMKRGAGRAYGVSFLAYVLLAFGIDSVVAGDSLNDATMLAVHLWLLIVMPVSLTALMFSGRRLGAWLIDAGYQLVYFAAMGAILSRWG
jgi:hypothetical protein